MGKNLRRSLLIAGGVGAGAIGTRHLYRDTTVQGTPLPANTGADRGDDNGSLTLNDASELSATRVARHELIEQVPGSQLLTQLRGELRKAATDKLPVVTHTARHSMGGQSLAANGVALSLEQRWLELDAQNKTYRVAAGMRWRDVIQALDVKGFSPAVMQSNNDFGVASTFCVNAHGWPVPFSGFGSTVRSIRLLLANGDLLECSRDKNQQHFNMAMGGYGLTGIITDLTVDMVPNALLDATYEILSADEFGPRFAQMLATDSAVQMAYGRMDISLDSFLDEAMLISFRPAKSEGPIPAAAGSGWFSRFSRTIFRSQLDSNSVKSARWWMEKDLAPSFTGEGMTRNSLMNEPVVTLDDRDPNRTDILHEYFVEPERFGDFVRACQRVIPSSYQDLLNITLRYVATDQESTLSYAGKPRIAAVMLFSQEKSIRAEQDMARMTRDLIDAVLAIDGNYYLPYRLHATDKQFRRAYRRASEFVAFKRSVDPALRFRNALWDRYLANLAST